MGTVHEGQAPGRLALAIRALEAIEPCAPRGPAWRLNRDVVVARWQGGDQPLRVPAGGALCEGCAREARAHAPGVGARPDGTGAAPAPGPAGLYCGGCGIPLAVALADEGIDTTLAALKGMGEWWDWGIGPNDRHFMRSLCEAVGRRSRTEQEEVAALVEDALRGERSYEARQGGGQPARRVWPAEPVAGWVLRQGRKVVENALAHLEAGATVVSMHGLEGAGHRLWTQAVAEAWQAQAPLRKARVLEGHWGGSAALLAQRMARERASSVDERGGARRLVVLEGGDWVGDALVEAVRALAPAGVWQALAVAESGMAPCGPGIAQVVVDSAGRTATGWMWRERTGVHVADAALEAVHRLVRGRVEDVAAARHHALMPGDEDRRDARYADEAAWALRDVLAGRLAACRQELERGHVRMLDAVLDVSPAAMDPEQAAWAAGIDAAWGAEEGRETLSGPGRPLALDGEGALRADDGALVIARRMERLGPIRYRMGNVEAAEALGVEPEG